MKIPPIFEKTNLIDILNYNLPIVKAGSLRTIIQPFFKYIFNSKKDDPMAQ